MLYRIHQILGGTLDIRPTVVTAKRLSNEMLITIIIVIIIIIIIIIKQKKYPINTNFVKIISQNFQPS